MVSSEELSALSQEYASGARSKINARFLSVVREGAVAAAAPAVGKPGAPKSGSDGAAPAAAASPLLASYQRLYIAAVLQSLRSCLDGSEAVAAARLAELATEPGPWAAPAGGLLGGQQVSSQVEAALNPAVDAPRIEMEQRMSLQARVWCKGSAGGANAALPSLLLAPAPGCPSILWCKSCIWHIRLHSKEFVQQAAARAHLHDGCLVCFPVGPVPLACLQLKALIQAPALHPLLQEDDDSTAYEPLEAAPRQHTADQPAPPQLQEREQPGMQAALTEQLAQLADHLGYQWMSDSAAWRELGLMQRVAGCLAAARAHQRWAELRDVAQALLRLAADRLAACPAELEAGLPGLLDALGIPGGRGGSGSGRADGSAVGSKQAAALAAELAMATAVALATQVSSPAARRRLWAETHSRLLPVAAAQLEEQQAVLARAARCATAAAAGGAAPAAAAQLAPEQLYRVMVPCQLLYFYVLEAPRVGAGPASGAQLQDAFLKGGLLRALVLLFCQLSGAAGAEPLRCALLLACTAAQPLADWAAAVPGFAAAVGAPALAPGGDAALHGALWRVLLHSSGSLLAALLQDATPAAKVRNSSLHGAVAAWVSGQVADIAVCHNQPPFAVCVCMSEPWAC